MISLTHKKVFGLEISDASIRVLELKKGGNFFRFVGLNKKKLPKKAVIKGEVKDFEITGQTIKEVLATAKPKKIKTPYLICSLPETYTFIREITLPNMTDEELDEAIKWETEQHIPLASDQVYLDWQQIEKKGGNNRYLVAACQKNIIDGYLNLLKSLKLKPVAFEPEAISLARAIIPKADINLSTLIVDLGKTKTLFDIQSEGIVKFTSSSEISGNLFTQKIAKNLGIEMTKAEKAKISCCSPETTQREQAILKAIHSILDELAKEIEKIIHYFNTHYPSSTDISKIIISGGGANLSGISPYLGLKLKKKVAVGNPLINTPVKKYNVLTPENAHSYAKVIGLALRDVYFAEKPPKKKPKKPKKPMDKKEKTKKK